MIKNLQEDNVYLKKERKDNFGGADPKSSFSNSSVYKKIPNFVNKT